MTIVGVRVLFSLLLPSRSRFNALALLRLANLFGLLLLLLSLSFLVCRSCTSSSAVPFNYNSACTDNAATHTQLACTVYASLLQTAVGTVERRPLTTASLLVLHASFPRHHPLSLTNAFLTAMSRLKGMGKVLYTVLPPKPRCPQGTTATRKHLQLTQLTRSVAEFG